MFSKGVIQVAGIQKVEISCISLAFLELGSNLILDLFELLRRLGNLARERPMERFAVDLGQELRIAGKLLLEQPGNVEGPIGRDPHECLREAGSQSLASWASPISVSGWRKSWSTIGKESVTTSAPMRAASRTCTGLRTDSTRTSVWNP